ncbi:MAG: penicillin-binding protein 2 [Alphaproteobacteria bacterium]|nr:penicillin-binding protein 2 [Alphaproteobacteria bacterium]
MSQSVRRISMPEASRKINLKTPKNTDHNQIFKRRLVVLSGCCLLLFGILFGRLIVFGMNPMGAVAKVASSAAVLEKPRADIVDRNGVLLASDIRVPSLFANPQKIENVEETLDQLALVFDDLNWDQMRTRLNSNARFAWIKREIGDEQKQKLHNLGIPGLFFNNEKKRIYPSGNLASHVLGHVNIDHVGKAGLESFINYFQTEKIADYRQEDAGKIYKPLVSSIDLAVQHVMRDELSQAIVKFDAIAAMGLVMDIHTGEVISMVSLPDYDPNIPKQALETKRMNRTTGGVYELGSVFKLLTMGMGLDYGVTTLEGGYDATDPLSVGRGKFIGDYHGKGRYLTVPEIFKFSSNIATAKMALDVGKERQQAFLRKIKLLDKLETELPGSGVPQYPTDKNWKRVSTITISYGHGIAVTPLQGIAAAAAMMNGGYYVPPTFVKRSVEEAEYYRERVIKPETSRDLVGLMRLNVLEGSGKKTDVDGYLVGGKTGSAEKPINGKYDKDKLISSFLSVFPTDKPKYMMLVSIDEPKGLPETHGFKTAGWNATPTTANIIKRIAPLLGMAPRFDNIKIDGNNLLAKTRN